MHNHTLRPYKLVHFRTNQQLYENQNSSISCSRKVKKLFCIYSKFCKNVKFNRKSWININSLYLSSDYYSYRPSSYGYKERNYHIMSTKSVKFTNPAATTMTNNLSIKITRHPIISQLRQALSPLKKIFQIVLVLIILLKIIFFFKIQDRFSGLGKPQYDDLTAHALASVKPHQGYAVSKRLDVQVQHDKLVENRRHPHVNKWERYLSELSGVVVEDNPVEQLKRGKSILTSQNPTQQAAMAAAILARANKLSDTNNTTSTSNATSSVGETQSSNLDLSSATVEES